MAGDLDFSEFRNTQNIDERVCQFFLLYLITSALRPQLNWSLTNLWKSKNQSVNGELMETEKLWQNQRTL